LDGTARFAHVAAVVEAAAWREPLDLDEAQTAAVELVDGRGEVAYAGRVDQMSPARQVEKLRRRRGVASFFLSYQLTDLYFRVRNEVADEG
jgi:hypothetical protein